MKYAIYTAKLTHCFTTSNRVWCELLTGFLYTITLFDLIERVYTIEYNEYALAHQHHVDVYNPVEVCRYLDFVRRLR